jgi:hypothetical protein
MGKTNKKPSPTKPGLEPEPKPQILGTKRRYNVRPVDGGFRISGSHDSEMLPEQLSVNVAYDVRRGNPFKKFRPFDFDLSGKGNKISAVGCEVSVTAPNRLVIRPDSIGFEVTVAGFDVQRDLVVRVEALGGRE